MYTADLTAGSLLVPESMRIAGLLLQGATDEQFRRAILIDNILQKKSQATARRVAQLCRNRLELMTPALWRLVVDGSADERAQALLAAAVKQSRLLGDFMRTVLREQVRLFIGVLSKGEWRQYLDTCSQIDPAVATWAQTSRDKLGEVVFRILAESKYIDSTRSRRILPVALAPRLRRYLVEQDETYVLNCMEPYR
jgi:hypothetical protein